MPNFIFFTDVHGKGSIPVSRKDNYPQTVLDKLEWVMDYANSKDAYLLCGGDIVDSPDVSSSFIGDMVEVFKKAKKPIFTVVGNHDEYGYNPSTFKRTPLAIAVRSGILRRLSLKPTIIDNEVQLTGIDSHYLLDKNGRISDYVDVPNFDGVKIHILHGFLSQTRWPKVPVTLISDIAHTNADIILTGHEHKGFSPIEINGKIFHNPGALLRVTSSVGDINREVRIGEISTNRKNFNVIETRVPIARPSSEVLDLDKVAEEKRSKQNMSEFIDSIKSVDISDTVDIFSILDEVIAELGGNEKVINICKAALTTAQMELDNIDTEYNNEGDENGQ